MSSSQVIRLSSGDTIQVRTGTIQGIGPQGPAGPSGPAGPAGPQGESGERGSVGQVEESLLYAYAIPTYQSLVISTDSLVTLAAEYADDYAARQSPNTFSLPVGNYTFSANATFVRSTGTQTGARILRLLVGGVVQWEASQPVISVGTTTSLSLSGGLFIETPGLAVALQAWHNDSVSILLNPAKLWISRVGAGLTGPQGATGLTGPQGATGAAGPAGPSGAIGNNNTTFGDID